MTTTRRRVRWVTCPILGCETLMRRGNPFNLCVEHLIAVWEFMADDVIPDEVDRALRVDRARAHVFRDHKETEVVAEARARTQAEAPLRSARTDGTLYVLDAGDGHIKIGWTSRELWQRLRQYPPHFRLILSIPGSRADERDAHRSLRTSLVAGREWYSLTPSVLHLINTWIEQANDLERQRLTREKIRSGWANPDYDFTPRPLPTFTSVDDWFRVTMSVPDGAAGSAAASTTRPRVFR